MEIRTNPPANPRGQIQTTPSETKHLSEKLGELKLYHWQKALETDWASLKPNTQQLIAAALDKWASIEISERRSQAIARRIQNANFIRIQTVDNFDFQHNASTKAIEKTYLKLHRDTTTGVTPRAVFVGTTGLGKTHLARALGYVACQAGTSVLFTKAAQIVNHLAAAKAVHNLEQELRKYQKPKLLIVDELGYVSLDAEAGHLFFQVISDRHDRGLGTIVTTNYPFGNWNQIFAAESTALVLVERLTADAEVFYLEGPSYLQTKRKKRDEPPTKK